MKYIVHTSFAGYTIRTLTFLLVRLTLLRDRVKHPNSHTFHKNPKYTCHILNIRSNIQFQSCFLLVCLRVCVGLHICFANVSTNKGGKTANKALAAMCAPYPARQPIFTHNYQHTHILPHICGFGTITCSKNGFYVHSVDGVQLNQEKKTHNKNKHQPRITSMN